MARVTQVKAAAKDYPEHDIKKGETYWWWKFARGAKQYSKTRPKPAQLTQSGFRQAVLGIEEDIGNLLADNGLKDAVDGIVAALQELASEQEAKKSNMPDSLQNGSTGELLQERADALNAAADELEGIDFSGPDDCESEEFKPDPEKSEADNAEAENEHDQFAADDCGQQEDTYWQEKLDEVQGVSIDAS